MIELSVIVAASENGVIGNNNALPWRISEDLKYFKHVTLGKPVIMGRKTFESIGKPLPGRTNIVITRDCEYPAEGVSTVTSLNEAVALAMEVARADGVDEVFVIGGAQIYREAIPRADRLYLTQVHAHVEGDAYLPDLDLDNWREASRERHEAEPPGTYNYSFVVYERLS